MKSQENRRYPIGKFGYGKTYSLDETRRHIRAIAKLPKELKKALKKLKSNQLDLPYRRGGWTARQVVHHIVDSHMNAYIRMKLAVTEQTPIIKPYEESLWAETDDGKSAPVKLSLRILAPLHKRWVMFLESLSEEDLERGYFHPEMKRVIPLPEAIALYAWHGQHHAAHIRLVASAKKEAEIPATTRASRKPRGQRAQVVEKQAAAAPRRKRRSSAEVAAEKAAKAAAPKLSRAEILAKARAARAASIAKKAPVTSKKTAAAPKRKRRSSAEVAAEKAAKAAAPKLSRAEILAKARAARAANIAKKAPVTSKKTIASPKRKRRSSAEVAAEKAAKAAAPKLSRAEILAKARAARAASIAKKAPAKPKAKPSSGTKRRGLSPERMAEIRAMRKKKN